MNKNQQRLKQMVLMALFIAMSVIGAFIKIPSPTGSVSLDSLPGYLAALLIGGIPGAIVAFLGHLASAATTGFSMTLPIHLLVACQMAVIMLILGYLVKRIHLAVVIVLGMLLNGIAAPATFILIPGFGTAFFSAMVLPLSIASIIVILIAGAIYYPLRNVKAIKELQKINHGL